ncbi:Low temperature requirement A [Metarhizium brunneum]
MLEDDFDQQNHQHQHKKLRIFSSPLVRRTSRLSQRGPAHGGSWRRIEDGHDESNSEHHHGQDYDLPQFQRYEEPTLLEIFYDLFFAANYNVFNDTQQVTGQTKFKASVGYFCLLWLTWFQVALFDVRYVTDSLFARATRAIQLGVLVGFVVVAPKFNPKDQDLDTMRAMSLILCFSRACLAVEYASTLWHVRRYKKAHMPLYLQIALHAAASAVYLGVTFRFTREKQSRVYMTWYFIAGGEAILSLLLSNLSPVASLTKTHLMKRMTLLTVMIMGEGIQQLAKEVVTIVKNPTAWDSTTIGLVTAGTTTIYLVFLVYFDWLRDSFYLPRLRQQLWTSLHLPFHLALVLFMQGFTQYLLWSKITGQAERALNIADPFDDAKEMTSLKVRDSINASVQAFFQDYPPKILSTVETVNQALSNFTTISNSFWPLLVNGTVPSDLSSAPPGYEADLATTNDAFLTLSIAMYNALFGAFGINLDEDVSHKYPTAAKEVKDGGYQVLILSKTLERYYLVFAYGYIAAGCTIVLMVLLTIVARTTPFKPWPIARLAIILLLGLGTGLVATLWYDDQKLGVFLATPWVLPTITFVWAAIFILTHLNGQGIKRNRDRLRRRKDGGSLRDEADVAMTPSSQWGHGHKESTAYRGSETQSPTQALYHSVGGGQDDRK